MAVLAGIGVGRGSLSSGPASDISNEKQLVAKCGRNRCNCFNGNNDSFGDELDIFDGLVESVTNGLLCDTLDALEVKTPLLLRDPHRQSRFKHTVVSSDALLILCPFTAKQTMVGKVSMVAGRGREGRQGGEASERRSQWSLEGAVEDIGRSEKSAIHETIRIFWRPCRWMFQSVKTDPDNLHGPFKVC
ncbi:hypothetical protein NL676_009488 [Syzygium grande]|nr:hypothetical protein NL676_009488 [Syzygium grande]